MPSDLGFWLWSDSTSAQIARQAGLLPNPPAQPTTPAKGGSTAEHWQGAWCLHSANVALAVEGAWIAEHIGADQAVIDRIDEFVEVVRIGDHADEWARSVGVGTSGEVAIAGAWGSVGNQHVGLMTGLT